MLSFCHHLAWPRLETLCTKPALEAGLFANCEELKCELTLW